MADILQEKWMQGVAITTTVLAVMTSIVSAQSNTSISKTQILTAEEAMKWQYYQAKSTRVQLIDVQKGILQTQMLGVNTPEQKTSIEERLAAHDENRAKYDKQAKELSAQAKELGKKKATTGNKGNRYMLSVVFFQIAIMLSSVSALLKRKELWLIGLMFGVIAAGLFINGYFFVV